MRAFDYHIQQSSIMFIKAKSYIHMQSLKTEIEEKTKTKKQKHNRKPLQKQKTNRLRVPKTSLHYTTQTKTDRKHFKKKLTRSTFSFLISSKLKRLFSAIFVCSFSGYLTPKKKLLHSHRASIYTY